MSIPLPAFVAIPLATAFLLPMFGKRGKDAATVISGNIKGAVPLGDLIDVKEEKKRMINQISEQKKASTGLTNRLKNKDFLKKAPKEVVEKEKTRLDSINTKIKELEKVVSGLKL